MNITTNTTAFATREDYIAEALGEFSEQFDLHTIAFYLTAEDFFVLSAEGWVLGEVAKSEDSESIFWAVVQRVELDEELEAEQRSRY